MLLATGLAFSTALSLVPLLAVSLSVFNYLGGFDRLIAEWIPRVLSLLATGAGPKVVHTILEALDRSSMDALGVFAFISLLFSSTILVHGIETSIQKVWGLKASKRLWLRLLGYWAVIFLVPIVLATLWGVVESGWIPYANTIPASYVIWVSISLAAVLILKWVPNTRVRWDSALIGGVFIGIALRVAQKLYIWIIGHILFYNKIYGSLAAIPIFLVWLLLGWYIFFFGTAMAARRNQITKSP